MVLDRPFFESLISDLVELEIEDASVYEVYSVYKQDFQPTLGVIKALKEALEAKKLSIEAYHEALCDYVKWYNEKFDKDIDSTFVENKLRSEENEEYDSEDFDEADVKDFGDKNEIMISWFIRYERDE